MSDSNLQDWEVKLLKQLESQGDLGETEGKQMVPEEMTPPTEPEKKKKKGTAAGDSSSAGTSLESPETEPIEPEVSLDELEDMVKNEPYVKTWDGRKVYKDEYEASGYKYWFPHNEDLYPPTFEEFAERYGEIYYDGEKEQGIEDADKLFGEEGIVIDEEKKSPRGAVKKYLNTKRKAKRFIKTIARENEYTNRQEIVGEYFGLELVEEGKGGIFKDRMGVWGFPTYVEGDTQFTVVPGGVGEPVEYTQDQFLDDEIEQVEEPPIYTQELGPTGFEQWGTRTLKKANITVGEFLGEKRYKEWLELTGGSDNTIYSGTLEGFDLNLVTDGTKERVVNEAKQRAAEAFTRNMGRGQTQRLFGFLELEGTVFDELIKENYWARLKDEVDYKKGRGGKLVRPTTSKERIGYGNRLYIPRSYSFEEKSRLGYFADNITSADKDDAFDEQYDDALKVFEADLNFVGANFELWEEQYQYMEGLRSKYNERLDEIKSVIDPFVVNGKLVFNSKEDEAIFNQAKQQYNDLIKEKAFVEFDQNYNKLAGIQKALNDKLDKLNEAAPLFNDISYANEAIMKNYSLYHRASQAMSEFFLGGSYQFFAESMNALSYLSYLFGGDDSSAWRQWGEALAESATDYNEKLQEQRAETLPLALRFKDIERYGVSFWQYGGEMLAENSPTLLISSATLGYGALAGTGVTVLQATSNASKLAMGAFGIGEGGMYLAETALAKRNAPQNIKDIEAGRQANILLGYSGIKDQLQYDEAIAFEQNNLNKSGLIRGIGAATYAGTAAFWERYSTMGIVKNAQKMNRSIGYKYLSTRMRPSLALPISKSLAIPKLVLTSSAINIYEETMTLASQNFFDIGVAQEKKSIFEGADIDFLLGTAFTATALTGPAIGRNLYAAVTNPFISLKNRRQQDIFTKELLEIQEELNSDKISAERRKQLRDKRFAVLTTMNLYDADVLLKLPDMQKADVQALISIDRDLVAIYNEASALGQEGEIGAYGKRQLEQLKKQSEELNAKKEELLGKSEKEIAEKYKGAVNQADAVFNYGLFRRSVRLAEANSKFNLSEIRTEEDLEAFFNANPKISEKDKAEITVAFQGKLNEKTGELEGRANALEVNGKILVFSQFIEDQIGVLDDLNAKIAAVSPLHEIGHLKTRQAGVLSDPDIVEKADKIVQEVRQALIDKAEINGISEQDLEIALERLDYYDKKSKSGEVNVDEAFQLVGDLINTGAIDANSFTSLYDFKSFALKTVKKLFGPNTWTMQLNNSGDIFNFASSWTKKIAEGEIIIRKEKEKKTGVKESAARGDLLQTINSLVPETVQTQADFFDRKVFNPIYNDGKLHPAITNYIRNKAVSPEEAQKIIESVADRLINFNPEAKRKSGEGKITLGEFIFSNVNFGQRDARKALFEESQERAQIESTDSEQARQIATVEESAPQAEKPKYKSLTQRKVLSEEAMTSARQKVLSIARVLKSPIDAAVSKNVTVTPLAAEIKKAVGKQLDIDFKKEMGGLKDGQLRKYLLKNKAAILENMTTTWLMTAMPNAVQKQVNGIWTSDWKGKKIDRESVSTDNAGRTSGAEMVRRLPKAATKLSDADFLSNFFTKDGKLIRGRKESLAKAMAEEKGFEIIREALNDPNSEITQAFLASQERAGVKDLNNIGVKFDVMAERGNVKFSIALGKINDKFNPNFDLELQGQNQGNALLAIHGLSDMDDLRTEEGQDAYIEDLKLHIFPSMPKEFFFGPGGGSIFTSSSKLMGGKSKSFPKEKRDAMWNRWRAKVKELSELGPENFGEPIPGISSFQVKSYTTLFKDVATIEKSKANGEIVKFNNQVSKIHRAMWARFAEVVQKDKNAARAIMKFMHHGVNNMSHPQRMGAQFVGYSEDFVAGKETGTFEHAMPNISAYTYLMDAALRGADFNAAYNAVIGNYKLIALSKNSDDKLTGRYKTKMPEGWDLLENTWWERYFNPDVFKNNGGIDPNSIITMDGRRFGDAAGIKADGTMLTQKAIEFNKQVDKQALADTKEAMEPSVRFSRATPRAVFMVGGPGAGKTNVGKGLKLGRRGFKVINQDLALEPMKIEAGLPANEQQYTREQRSTRAKLGAAARKAAEAKMAKYMGFGESMVVDGTGASYNATMKKINALREAGYEVSIVFANTSKEEAIARNKARAERALPDSIVERTWDAVQESAKLYKQEFGDKFYEVNTNELKLGQDLPAEFLNKLYQDLDVDGVKYSAALSKKFNRIIERRTGVDAVKNFSRIQAQMRGRNKGRFKFFIAPGADDFRGLVHYAFAGKGKQGEADMAWFEEKLMTPYFKGVSAIDAMRQQIKRDFRAVTKQFKEEYKLLRKKIGTGQFTYDHALRVYMWNRQGLAIEGLSKRDKKSLLDAIEKNPELVSLADALLVVARRDEWPDPVAHWEAGSVLSDLNGMTEKIGRKKFLQEFIENAEVIFSEENLNKIEAIYGRRHREAIEDSLYAMKNGSNRPTGANRQVNAWLNWINGSTGAIMFFNRRSALLQMLSFTNFINWSDNNMVKAAAAFANQKQYWSDWTMIFNSDKLKERRGGLKQDVSESEIADVAGRSKNSPQAILAYLLKIGFTPTQIADSMAIATGGAMFYRNRVNTYLKQGMDQKAAEEQAFLDFSMKSDEAQQSSDPALVSQQQRSVLGRLVLAFANTPMQYTRLMKKAGQDLINGRGRPIENISKIAYYGVIQNFIFSALQSAMFAMFFDDDDDEDMTDEEREKMAKKDEQKTIRVANSMMDTVLRGSGVYGAVASTIKNTIMEYYKQEEKGFMADHTYTILAAAGISPPIQSKMRKIYSAIQTSKFERDNVEQRGWAITADGRLNLGPNWSIFGNVLSGVTNIPLDRVVDEMRSVSEALDERNKAWQRIALALGWKTWDVGVRNEEADLIKSEAKEVRKQEGIRKAKETRRINTEAKKKKEAEESKAAFEAWEMEFIKNQRKNQEN